MGNFGVLEDHKLPHVPGTILLDDDSGRAQTVTALLKHGTGKDKHIVLAPQPSDNPNDPLNWPMWKKEICMAILCYGAILNASVNACMLNPAYVEIAKSTGKSLHDIVLVGGYNLLTTGTSGFIFSALSRKFGKRPCFLAATLFGILGTVIGQSGSTYEHILATRIIQGLSTSAFESLVFPVIGDMYFVHQRGLRIAIANCAILVSTSLATIIAGQVYNGLGLKWVFHMYQIFLVVQFIATFFLCPETTFVRNSINETDEVQEEHWEELAQSQKHRLAEIEGPAGVAVEEVEKAKDDSVARTTTVGSFNIPKKTFFQELAITSGIYTKDSFFMLLAAPFVTLLNPAALFAIVTAGLFSTWGVALMMVSAGIFTAAPWHFRPSQIALISIGPLIGGLLGTVIVSIINDPTAKWMARRNSGIYEPEFRLIHLPWCAVFLGGGLFLFGHFVQIGAGAVLCSFWFGFQKVGLLVGTVCVMSFALDGYRSSSNEIFIMSMTFKNFLFYAVSTFSTNWIAEKGAFEVGAVFGGVNIGLCLLGGLVYVWGKRLRSFWARHNLLERFHIQSSGPDNTVAH